MRNLLLAGIVNGLDWLGNAPVGRLGRDAEPVKLQLRRVRSSTLALIAAQDDHVVTVAPALDRVGDFRTFLGEDFDEAMT